MTPGFGVISVHQQSVMACREVYHISGVKFLSQTSWGLGEGQGLVFELHIYSKFSECK